MPQPAPSALEPVPFPAWDLPARMLVATVFVVVLTTIAPLLGARLAGLLAPFPLYGSVLAAFAHALPVRDGWADVVTACASIGSQPPLGGEAVLGELERCCRPGGAVALIGPEDPSWFEARGYRRLDFGQLEAPPCDPEVEAFFGPRDG